jgi:hypothetical protein
MRRHGRNSEVLRGPGVTIPAVQDLNENAALIDRAVATNLLPL